MLGRPRRGAAFFVIVAVAFAVGLLLGGELVTPDRERPLRLLGTLAVSATGVLDLLARRFGLGAGDPRSRTFEYGTTYLLTAGVMNVLLVLDAVELALGRKR